MVQRRRSKLDPGKIRKTSGDDLPATVRLVKEVRFELLSEVAAVRHGMSAMEKRLDGKFEGIHSQISAIHSEMHGMRAEISDVRSEISDVRSEVSDVRSEVSDVRSEVSEVRSEISGMRADYHGMRILMEEQRSENRIVLDGLRQVLDRQDRVEQEIKEIKGRPPL